MEIRAFRGWRYRPDDDGDVSDFIAPPYDILSGQDKIQLLTRSDKNIVAVPWGNYSSAISGGTGKFADATGTINYFGMADFTNSTLVLRYSGTVCYQR